MPNDDTFSTTRTGLQGPENIAKEAWNKADPFPIAKDIRKLKVAVTTSHEHKTQLEAALIYAKFGVPVFPCNWKPDKDGKIRKYPLVGEGGLYLATIDPTQIQEWWTKWPEALIGVPMGRRVGMWGVDADSKEKKGDVDGVKAWFDLQSECSDGINNDGVTRAHKTGTGGLHFLYLWENDRFVGCPTMKGIGEIKGEGGYLIFPPSPYALDGRILSYSVSQDIEPEPAPDWLYDKIIGSRPKSNGPWTGGSYDWSENWVKSKLDEVCEQVRTATKGHWDEVRATKVFLFGRYVGDGAYDADKAWEEIEKAAKQCDAPDDYVGEVKRAFFRLAKPSTPYIWPLASSLSAIKPPTSTNTPSSVTAEFSTLFSKARPLSPCGSWQRSRLCSARKYCSAKKYNGAKTNSHFRGIPSSPTSTTIKRAMSISLGLWNAMRRRCARTSASIL